MKNSTILLVLALSCGLAAAAVTMIKKSKKNKKDKIKQNKGATGATLDSFDLDQKILQHLDHLYEKYLPEYLSYAITEQAFSLPLNVKEELTDEYSHTLSLPVIPWPDEFNFVPSKYYSRVDIGIENYMKNNNITCSKSGSPSYVFREAMLERARNHAGNIIKQKLFTINAPK